MKWNLLKDKKPEMEYNRHIQVIVTNKWGEATTCHVAKDGYGNLHWNASVFHDGRYSFENEMGEERFVAWMYMPEPYKEEEEGDEEW